MWEHRSEGIRSFKPKQHVHSCLLTQNDCKHIAIWSAREAFILLLYLTQAKRDEIHFNKSSESRFAKQFWMGAILQQQHQQQQINVEQCW